MNIKNRSTLAHSKRHRTSNYHENRLFPHRTQNRVSIIAVAFVAVIAHPDKISEIAFINWNSIDVSSVDTKQAAIDYCTGYLGMTAERVDALIDIITA